VLHPTPCSEGSLGATARGSLDSRSCSRIGLDCSGRKVHGCPRLAKAGEADCSSRPQAPRPAGPIAFGETMANAGSAHPSQKGSSCCEECATEGSEAGSRPFPRPTTPRTRVRCPEGPSIKGPHRIGQSMLPGRPGSRVIRQKPWLRRQAQPRPTEVGNRTIRRVLVYVSQLQTLK